MLTITIPAREAVELWDERTERFVEIPRMKEQTLQLEHSLVSVRKWESKWHKPFLSKEEKTQEETLDYIRCMTITQNVNPEVYNNLTNENIIQVNKYIEDPMTATTFSDDKAKRGGREIITAEIIYYWMIALQIPKECEKWHLNQLLALVKVCNIKNTPPKKRSKRSTVSQYAAINAARRQQLNSNG